MTNARFISEVASERRPRSRPPRSPELRLRADEVDLWRVPLDGFAPPALSQCEALLSAEERARVHRFFFERDRRRAIVARGALRLLLARYTARAPREVRFAYGPHGKPRLAVERDEPEIFFNVAHAEDLALYAFTRTGEVGIDVERVRELPDWEQIAATCFSSSEAARIRAADEAQRAAEFLRAWTEHEAVLKARGTGLGDPAAMDSRCGNATAADPAGLRVHTLDVGPRFVGTLALGAAARWAICRSWQPAEIAEFRFPVSSRRERIDPLSNSTIFLP